MCDQRIKVIREIDPFVDEPDQAKAPMIPQNNRAVPMMPNETSRECTSSASHAVEAQHSAVHAKSKPKIVTIGDMQVKYDGDKVYQKQWVQLTAAEASNIRVVNDANNKIFPLNGKHIECRKWVVVEEDRNEDDDDVTSNMGD